MGNSSRQDTRSPPYELESVAPPRRPSPLVLPPCYSAPIPSTLPPPAYELHSQDISFPAEARRNTRRDSYDLESQSSSTIFSEIASSSPSTSTPTSETRTKKLSSYKLKQVCPCLLLVGAVGAVGLFIYGAVKAAGEGGALLVFHSAGEDTTQAQAPQQQVVSNGLNDVMKLIEYMFTIGT